MTSELEPWRRRRHRHVDGIGAASALRLADAGFSVFAGVRRAVDGEALRSRANGERDAGAHRHHRPAR